jgi:hypothetical protein
MKLTERPYTHNWSLNDIRYVFNTPLTGTTLQVKIMVATSTSGSFTELITLSDLTPDSNGNVYVYIQGYLNSLLNYVIPVATQFATAASDHVRKFYVEYREVSDDNIDATWRLSESTHVCYVLKGGIELLKSSSNNYFTNYFATNKPFLTWLPHNRFVYADQYAFLCFLNTSGGSSVGFKLKFAFVDTAGLTYNYTYTFTDNDILFHLNASPTNPLFPAFTNPLWYYDVTVTNSSDTGLSETYRLYVEYRPVYEFWDLFWHNSLGGFDGCRVVGETTLTINKNYAENGAGKDVTDVRNNVRSHYLQHTAITKRNSYKGDIGYQKNKEENEALQEVLLSKSIYYSVYKAFVAQSTLQLANEGNTSASSYFFTLKGTPLPGDSVTVNFSIDLNNIDGVNDYTVTSVVGSGDTLADLITDLYNQIFAIDVNAVTYIDGDGNNGVRIRAFSSATGTTTVTTVSVIQPVILWYPVLNVQKSQDLRTSKSRIFSFPIEWQLASEDEVFTPKDTDLGLGVVIPVCDPITIISTEVPDVTAGDTYSGQIKISGTSPFTITPNDVPTWLMISVIEDVDEDGLLYSYVVLSGTAGAAADNVVIDFGITNCYGTEPINETIDINAEGGDTGTDTHWMPTTFVSGDALHSHEQKQIKGAAGATVTVTVTNYANNNGGTLQVGASMVTAIGNTFTYVLDGSGLSSVIDFYITGLTHPGSAILGKFTISHVTAGAIGSPVDYQTSKVFS